MQECFRLRLLIVHHHFRPGGVRRVIEIATPYLVAHGTQPTRVVVLAVGEAPDPSWLRAFRRRLPGTPVKVFVHPAFGYASELSLDAATLRRRLAAAITQLLGQAAPDDCLVWAHNLALGRNLPLASQLASACHARSIPLIAHHHDWWFDNRWHHFAAARDPALRGLEALAKVTLPASPSIAHIAINRADAAVLQKSFHRLSGWLPNPVEREPLPSANRVQAARAWLSRQLGDTAPVWLLPCRLLRRKNVAEALLLTRWLRPEAWLVTTAGVSSADEQPYADALAAAAKAHGWRLRLGILHGNENQKPTVPELLSASEAVLLTLIQEGFGLSNLEAAAARRPLIARELPNIAPDLAEFGFTFPQSYKEVLVHPALFDWPAEHQRQAALFARWKRLLPSAAARLVGEPVVLATGSPPPRVPFSRLTLTAQIEVLARPPEESWARCAPLNPALQTCRQRASAGKLQTSPWPRSAVRWLGGRAYARRFNELVRRLPARDPGAGAGQAAQQEFLRHKLRSENLYPLLWDSRT